MLADSTTLCALIKNEAQYVVPLYQRPYSWEEGHLERLWRDVVRQAYILAGGGEAGHFLGSVVLAPGSESTPLNTQWAIVDGQQRLTTLFLMLCVIRDHRAEEEDSSHRQRINNDFLINTNRSEDRRYRLLPTELDRKSFQSCVVGNSGEAEGNIGDAYRFFRSKLAALGGLTPPCEVQHVEEVVLNRLELVQITVDRGDSAFQVFESINNTGMRINQVDFIRNYVFMCLPKRRDEVYRDHWMPIQRRLGIKELDRLMHLVHVLTYGEQAERLDVYRGHQDLLEGVRDDEEKVEKYVHDLARRGGYLDEILRSDEKTEVGSSIAFLREFKPATVYPVIMRLLELRDEDHATDEEVALALRYIESFVVRRFVGQVTAPSLTRVLHRLAVRLPEDRPVAETVLDELSPMQWGWPSGDDFRRDIAEKAFYQRGNPRQQKAVLRRLEESHSWKERPDLSAKEITIEHVLPQSPTEDWLDGLEGQGGDRWAAHRRLVHTLGNLTLSAYNSELGNAPFARKREVLRKSGIALNHAIAECERWGEEEIRNRAQDLAERAIQIWPGPDESDQTRAVILNWSSLTRALEALPPATWVSYGDLAALVGSHVLPVRVYIGSANLTNGHRVLTSDGEPPSEGRTVSRAELRVAMGTLQAEGIVLDELGRAQARHRITARELAVRLGLEGTENLGQAASVLGEHQRIDEEQRKFFQQLCVEAGPHAAGAVQRLLEQWASGGGEIRYGSGGASCAVGLKQGKTWLAVLRIYPKKVVIPVRFLMKRHPFDDVTVREELRERFNSAPGIEIPAAERDLSPSFLVTSLAAESVWDVVVACLDWLRATMNREA
ncbi:DUF262 domain-containing protein [Streptosporangium sp. NPDC050280]|uniref:GmrSD restriction endonuclease domain-containing protein n=1 Tax=unclassified Streptosporangium TaxID=2632669 RepID=UPI0034263386